MSMYNITLFRHTRVVSLRVEGEGMGSMCIVGNGVGHLNDLDRQQRAGTLRTKERRSGPDSSFILISSRSRL
jgi:hypothetical protein